MAWFNFLLEEGFFNPKNNPIPKEIDGGIETPEYWEVLGYLERLSLEIKNGKALGLINKLIDVIKDVSTNPVDNYKTWYVLIKILGNLPNNKISKDILAFIPIWLSGKFDTMLQTSELFENILLKFLNTNPSKEDIEKAELILQLLFEVERKERKEGIDLSENSDLYSSRLDMPSLSSAFEDKELISKIVKHCSDTFILDLGRTIRKILICKNLTYTITYENKQHELEIYIEESKLTVLVNLAGVTHNPTPFIIEDYEGLDKDNLTSLLLEALGRFGITYIPESTVYDPIANFYDVLHSDMYSKNGIYLVKEFGDFNYQDENLINIFSRIFRDLLNETVIQNSERGLKFLKTICFDPKFSTTFFKRIAIYIVSQNWASTKEIFWELLGENDPLHLFSQHRYYRDIYALLFEKQILFTEKQKQILQTIIDEGEQNDLYKKDEEEEMHWKLKWYSALRNIEPFSEKYSQLSTILNRTNEYFEETGRLKLRSGSIPPISLDELLKLSEEKIAYLISSFQPLDTWEEPNVIGLSDILAAAVELEPERFAENIYLFDNTYYVYFYFIMVSFREAWKKEKPFNLEKVLDYCLRYIKNDKFYLDQFIHLADGRKANLQWAVGSIADFLNEGTKDYNNSFEPEHWPVVEEISEILVTNLHPEKIAALDDDDYLSHSYNSTPGKVLRTLIHYSVLSARNNTKSKDGIKWESKMRSLFEVALSRKILDCYILEGYCFETFCYLDQEWAFKQATLNLSIDEKYWRAFITSYLIGSPISNKEVYELLYPHFEQCIVKNIDLKRFPENGIVTHLTAFYLWGFEDLNSKKLLFNFLQNSTPKRTVLLISYISRQQEYANRLDRDEKKHFEQLILDLWRFLINKYYETYSEEEKSILASLPALVGFANELTEEYTQLIIKSAQFLHPRFTVHKLLKNLVRLKNEGSARKIADSIGLILTSMPLEGRFSDHDNEQINLKELVSFLFENNQKEAAIKICNKIALNGHHFLKEVYDRYR